MSLPDHLRTELLALLGDIKLFPFAWPEELIVKLMLISNEVEKHDHEVGQMLTVMTLAIMPPLPGEEFPEGVTPETLGKVVHGLSQAVVLKITS